MQDEMPGWRFALRQCGQARGSQSEVQHAPLAGAHGCKVKGLARGQHRRDGLCGGAVKSASAPGFETIGVEADLFVLFRRQTQHLGGKVLERQQKLAMVMQQRRGIRSLKLDFQAGGCVMRRAATAKRKIQMRIPDHILQQTRYGPLGGLLKHSFLPRGERLQAVMLDSPGSQGDVSDAFTGCPSQRRTLECRSPS